jgi:hypothetical protein
VSEEPSDDEFETPRQSSMSRSTDADDDFDVTPRESEYNTPMASVDEPMSPLVIQQKQLKSKITKQQIEQNNPMGVGKYKDCSNMNIDVITDPRELHARYKVCCPYRQTPIGTWKTKTPFCVKLDNKYKEKVNEINKPMIEQFKAVSASARDTDLSRDSVSSQASTVDKNRGLTFSSLYKKVPNGGRTIKRRRSSTTKRNKTKRRSKKSIRNKSKRNKTKRNKKRK